MTQKPYQLIRIIILFVILGIIFSWQIPVGAQVVIPNGTNWRSTLYPDNWTPGYKDSQGRFVQDFSYAGYKRGESSPPTNPGSKNVDVTKAPYYADKTGVNDATNAIQNAINYVGQNGGGIVYLPAGTYRVKPQAGSGLNGTQNQALYIGYSNVVLRGAGYDKTFIFNDATFMREKRVISFAPTPNMYGWTGEAETNRVNITSDLLNPTNVLPVSSTSGYSVGDFVIVRTDNSSSFKNEHGMGSYWGDASGMLYMRQITAINTGAKTLTIDIPIRYPMKTRDNARVYKVTRTILRNVGIDNLSIGMRQNTKAGLDESDYYKSGTAAYEVHYSAAILMNHVVDGWISNVRSYKPSQNTNTVHLLSIGVYLFSSRSITISNTIMGQTQYKGAGGNGYVYRLEASDILIRDSTAYGSRHNFLMQEMFSHGNVLHNIISKDELYPSDYHRFLSPANLVDMSTIDGTRLEAFNRGSNSDGAGITSSQSVYWNVQPGSTRGCHIRSEQFGWGYIIGTGCNVDVDGSSIEAPNDFVEGQGAGATLLPRSLYLDQLSRRRFGQGDDDADGRLNNQDNCPTVPNSDQQDSNGNGIGNACETPPPPPNTCVYQESGGQVIIEAEKYGAMMPGVSGDTWQFVTNFSNYSGTGALQASPNDGSTTNNEVYGPTLSYAINFSSTGTYYVSLRGRAANTDGNDDTIHVGLNGNSVTVSTQWGIWGYGSGFNWREESSPGVSVTIQVSKPGIHTFNVWMRKDGFVLDKIWLSKSNSSVLQGDSSKGPNESPCSVPTQNNDSDNDGVSNTSDNCPTTANADQLDTDKDGQGNACDTDDDNDNFADAADECPTEPGDLNGCPAPINACAFREVSGQVVIDAEKFSRQDNNTGTHGWQPITNVSGYTGTGAVQALPNNGTRLWNDTSPALIYFVKFQTTGTYYLSLRGYSATYNDDTVYVGLDGTALTAFTGTGLTGWTAQYSWRENGDTVLSIPTAGVYAVYVWMREDGMVLDKLWLSKNNSAVNNGDTVNGPSASPCDAIGSGPGSGSSGADNDGDGVGDASDNCPTVSNANQADADGDSKGDACDTDDDNDNFADAIDQCPTQFGDLDGCPAPTNSCAFREASGQVVIDAEKFSRQLGNTGTHGWQPITNISGYTGTGAMQILPNNGTRKTDGSGPRLVYFVKFQTPGSYTVAIRGYGPDAADDSLFFGLDGVAATAFSGTGLTGWAKQYNWQKSGYKLTIPATGIYAVYVWMREDGMVMDKLWLSTNSSAVASGSTTSGPSPAACDPFTSSDSMSMALSVPVEGDMDADGILDEVDNCPADANPNQVDTDTDGQGDACDLDDDNDGLEDEFDSCSLIVGTPELLGCADEDGDTVSDLTDNCPALANQDQLDTDQDDQGDACDTDDDNDEIEDSVDACPLEAGVAPSGCLNNDGDSDGIADDADNCPFIANPTQADRNTDGQGDACSDSDGDVIADDVDNCPDASNSDQTDTDGDGQGDACDPVETATPIPTATPDESVNVEPTETPVAIAGCAFVEVGGEVVIEAEDYTRTSSGVEGDSWQLSTGAPGYSGEGAMQAVPNNGSFKGLDITGPVLEYDIMFTTPGTYYVAVRGYAASGEDNSVHVGLDGVGVTNSSGTGLTDWGAAYTWRNRANNATVTVTIAEAGLHTINIWMREDGIVIDALWLSMVSNHVVHGSSASVPTTSPCEGLPDDDGDGVITLLDNCPAVANPDQLDSDGDGVGDACGDADGDSINDTVDNCPAVANNDQLDTNTNGLGDACDSDDDGDGVPDETDACPLVAGAASAQGCLDADNDGFSDELDNCPTVLNNDQLDSDTDGQGDACDPDDDSDTVDDANDTCPLVAGSVSANGCPDADGDGFSDELDNCPTVLNNDQLDSDTDGQGDACDPDDDSDTVDDVNDTCPLVAGSVSANGCPDEDGDGLTPEVDNCPTVANPEQVDADTDGLGDACDDDDDGDSVPDAADACPLVSAATANGCAETPTPEPTAVATTAAPVDTDSDGINDDVDNCPVVNDADQTDSDGDGFGNPCDDDDDNDQVLDNADICPLEAGTAATSGCPDGDADGFADAADNCLLDPNPDQLDSDADGQGDACDSDDDDDSISDGADACPLVVGTLSNGCPADPVTPTPETVTPTPITPVVTDSDADSIPDETDNCPLVYNLDQTDSDGDGVGDVCESAPESTPTATDVVPTETPIVTPPPVSTGACVRQEIGGVVVIEAEHYTSSQTGSPDAWLPNGSTVQAQPGINAMLSYDIAFQTPGTYYVALLSYTEPFNMGSLALVPQGATMTAPTIEAPAELVFAWQTQYNGAELSITVEIPGVYTLWLALSSDATIIDKLWLSNVPGFVTAGSTEASPDESLCVSETPEATPTDTMTAIPTEVPTETPTEVVVDTDTDSIPDTVDNCPAVYNLDQLDSDGNGMGDACEPVVEAPAQCMVYREVGGEIVMEAEHYTTLAPGAAGHNWQTIVDLPGYTGAAALQALPDNGVTTLTKTTGALVTYDFEVSTPGTYYLFMRGYGVSSISDSVHVGLDGVSVTSTSSIGLSQWVAAFSWQGRLGITPLTFNITAGRHTLNVWMREDGVVIDKIWLSTKNKAVSYGSADAGPAESPCAVPGASVTALTVPVQPPAATTGTNQPPVANAGADQLLTSDVFGNASVTLNGAASTDSDGTIISYAWTMGATPLANTNPATVSLPIGIHNVTLTVTDNQGATATDIVMITVQGIANQPPRANAGADQVLTADATGFATVILSGAGSTDSDGTITSYAWDNGGVQLGAGATLTLSLPVGTHFINLTVRDNRDGFSSDSVIITVNAAPNQPPRANAGGNQVLVADATGYAPVTLNGMASTDSDGTIVSYKWLQNGATLAEGSLAATDLPVGTHFITLTVTDDDGAQSSVDVVITVNTP